MAAPFLIRGLPLRIRPHHHRLAAGLFFGKLQRPAYTAAAESTCSEENVCPSSSKEAGEVLKVKDPPQLRIFDDPEYLDWKDKEKEILQDIEPITLLTKEILHSKRYRDGERLTAEDEQAVVDNLLSHHPNAEDKIGCGIDSIMVDRHPQFRFSRSLFVVRTDGGHTDFSYKKCLRAYVRSKYPSHAEGFISKHFRP